MADDVTTFCRKCEKCQLRKGPKKNIRSPMVKYLFGAPMERIGIDILLERFYHTLEDMISKYIADHQRNWDEHLQLLLLAYRTSVHNSTGFS